MSTNNGNSGWSRSTSAGLICAPMLFVGDQVRCKIVGEWMAAVDAASFKDMLLDSSFSAAMALYAVAALSWVLVQRVVRLGAAYCLTAHGFLFDSLVSWTLFGKALTRHSLAGAFRIIAGLLVMHA